MPKTKLPKVILVDQDGTLADFEGSFLETFRKNHSHLPHIPFEERSTFYIMDDYPPHLTETIQEIYFAQGFFRDLPPIPGAIEALNEMRKAGFIVKICTSPISEYKYCVEEKHAWVEKHLGRDWVRDVILTTDKTQVKGDILIDDRPIILGHFEPEWEHVIFDAPYNREVKDKRRLLNWADWRELLDTTKD